MYHKAGTQEVPVSHQDHPRVSVTSPCPQAGGPLNTLDKAHAPALLLGSQVASAFKTLGLVPTGPASHPLLSSKQGPGLLTHRKPGWVFSS